MSPLHAIGRPNEQMWIEESPDCQKLHGSQATRIPNFYRFSCLMPFGGSQCTPATSMQSQISTQSDPTHARIGAWVRQVYCVMHARRPQGRRDQRPVHSNARPANSLKFTAPTRGAWVRRRLATRRRRRSRSLHSSRPEGRRLRPRAWIPEESGQVGLDKSPQTRRRIAQDG